MLAFEQILVAFLHPPDGKLGRTFGNADARGRIRREYGSYIVRTDYAEAAKILSEIGFQIIK